VYVFVGLADKKKKVLIILVHCALVGFARAPYANKYATREEKVLAALERVEVFEIMKSRVEV
jgi:hypothetical protein